MYNILYVHGLGGSKNGATGKALQQLIQEQNINAKVYTEDFELTPIVWINQIKEIVEEKNIKKN